MALNTSCNFPAIFNFGDSNTDTGADSAAFSLITQPNGETFFHMPAGRPSDGRLTIDFMAERIGLPYLSAYLDSLGTNFVHGANFAVSGATIRPSNKSRTGGGPSPFYLDVQLSQFQQFKTRSQLIRNKGGIYSNLLPKEESFDQALYTFDMGQNDIGLGFFTNQSPEEVKAVIPDVITKFSKNVQAVYNLRGRSIWIHNTAPIGCLAYILTNFPVNESEIDKAGCATPYNEVSQYFNQKLKEAVVELRKQLPLAAITYVDIYSIKYLLISQAQEFGFQQPLVACCGFGGKYNYSNTARCGQTVVVDGKPVFIGSCADPSVRVSWDGSHFTEAANKFVVDQIATGKYTDPPITLQNACNRNSSST
ncbi:GDSL esterase/lipase At3g26430-like [Telopea speciosissima]|uniref:GDSL esterase/lipase At3g26430-like n=1 Tax=Telopea speciosissima TaxID=54955 RepID=UPI001CC63C0C|nr:GDSL esterase/lipase At3g26430-like [Telopea speciosissima]